MIDFVIINYNTPELTAECIQSIYDTYSPESRVVIVDNASSDNSVDYLTNRFDNVKIIVNETNLGYAKAVNIGVNNTNSEYAMVSNSDILFLENSIYKSEKYLQSNSICGICGFFQYTKNLHPLRSYGYLPGWKLAFLELFLVDKIFEKVHLLLRKLNIWYNEPFDVDYIEGAALLIRRSVFNEVGGFDEDYFFYSEEADFCLKTSRLGYGVTILPFAGVIHYKGASTKNEDKLEAAALMNEKSHVIFIRKNGSISELRFQRFSRITKMYIMLFIISIFEIINNKKSSKYMTQKRIFKAIIKFWRELKIG